MDEKFKKLFDLIKKNDELTVFTGDELHMGSVAPYGISSGIPELDLYLGRKGGLPASKIIEYYGKPMTGKTTASLQAAAEWQKREGLVIFIDTEHSYTPQRARELGCNPENIIKHEASTVEEVFKIFAYYLGEIEVESKRKSKKGILDELETPVLFIVDSITGVPTIADAQGDIDDSDRPGFEAKQIKRGIRKINPLLPLMKCKPSVIFINHAVTKIGGWGKQTDSGGGLGIKFYATIRIEFAGLSQIKEKDTKKRLGQKIKISIEKLKGSHLEFPEMSMELTNEYGFDKFESLKNAMLATEFASRPSNSRTITILPDTGYEEQFAQVNFRQWLEQKGGYDEVYRNWRRWCIREGILEPWGGKTS